LSATNMIEIVLMFGFIGLLIHKVYSLLRFRRKVSLFGHPKNKRFGQIIGLMLGLCMIFIGITHPRDVVNRITFIVWGIFAVLEYTLYIQENSK
jgi:uncharacterized membrane protein